MASKRRAMKKRRNPEALALTNPLFRPRVVRSRKTYSRKRRQDPEDSA